MKNCHDVQCKHYKHDFHTVRQVRTCKRHDFCLLEMTATLPSLLYRITTARERLARDEDEAVQVIWEMREWPEMHHARLFELAWLLSHDAYTHKNDVIGLLDDLEKWMNS